jgi:probable rRNA maturation factor
MTRKNTDMTIICEDNLTILNAVAAALSEKLCLPGDLCAEVVFISDGEEMRELNLRTRGIDAPTDVLSYPALNLTPAAPVTAAAHERTGDNGEIHLGSIALFSDKIREQAAAYGHSEARETAFLFAHGLLHLLGYDHADADGERKMNVLTEDILQKAGYARERGTV